MKAKIWLLCATLLLLAIVPACGKGSIKTEGVAGVVTLDGAPLANATVTFTPADGASGSQSYGKTNDKGEYKLQTLLGAADAGTTPGKYGVTVQCFKKIATEVVKDDEGEQEEEDAESLIPERYGKVATSGLEAEVVKGDNTFNFELTSK